jgi:ketopantoate reductase
MKLVVLGSVGAYYGGLLARAGHEVTCFAPGANLAAIAERGLEIRRPERAWMAAILMLHSSSRISACSRDGVPTGQASETGLR